MAVLRFPVGSQRITSSMRPSQAAYTRDARAAMEAVVKNFKGIVDAAEMTSASAISYALEAIYYTSQELVPVDTMRLKKSGYIDVRRKRGHITGEVGYGKGGDPHYAVFVHEMLHFYHKPPTQAKFLEAAVMRHKGELMDRYYEYLESEMGL